MSKITAALLTVAALLVSTSSLADTHATAVRLLSMPGTGNLQFVDVPVMPGKFDKDMLVILCDPACQKALHAAVAGSADAKQIEMPVKIMMDHDAYVASILGRTIK